MLCARSLLQNVRFDRNGRRQEARVGMSREGKRGGELPHTHPERGIFVVYSGREIEDQQSTQCGSIKPTDPLNPGTTL